MVWGVVSVLRLRLRLSRVPEPRSELNVLDTGDSDGDVLALLIQVGDGARDGGDSDFSFHCIVLLIVQHYVPLVIRLVVMVASCGCISIVVVVILRVTGVKQPIRRGQRARSQILVTKVLEAVVGTT
jgi:hypothetical protein